MLTMAMIVEAIFILIIVLGTGFSIMTYSRIRKVDKDLQKMQKQIDEILELQKRQGYTNNYRNYSQNYPNQVQRNRNDWRTDK